MGLNFSAYGVRHVVRGTLAELDRPDADIAVPFRRSRAPRLLGTTWRYPNIACLVMLVMVRYLVLARRVAPWVDGRSAGQGCDADLGARGGGDADAGGSNRDDRGNQHDSEVVGLDHEIPLIGRREMEPQALRWWNPSRPAMSRWSYLIHSSGIRGDIQRNHLELPCSSLERNPLLGALRIGVQPRGAFGLFDVCGI